MAHDIEPVAKLGLSLASSLQVHSEANRRGRPVLHKLINLINSTALTLIKVDDVIQENALTKLCIEDISSLTATCEKIYIGILIMLVRQTENIVGDKGISKISLDETGKYLDCVAHTSVFGHESWKCLEVQFRYFRHRLTQIKFELMLRYLLGTVAQHQMRTQTRAPGSFETENIMRNLAKLVARQRASHYNYWSKKVAKWTIITPSLPSSNVTFADVKAACSVSSSRTIAVETKIEEVKTVETIPISHGPVVDLPKDTEVSADTNAETTGNQAQIDQEPAKEDSSSLMSAVRNWIKRHLTPGSHDEWKDQDLEVWQIDLGAHFNPNSTPGETFRRLELDDKRVMSALAQVNSKYRWRKRPELLEQYDSLDQRVRQRIDDAIDAAQQSSSRERTWIAMSVTSPQFKSRSGAAVPADASISLFFRLGDDVDPIQVFEPNSGKTITFPYALCKDLNLLRKRLSGLSLGYASTFMLKDGNYVFCADDGTVILPEAWESLRRPGMTLKLQNPTVPVPPGWPVGVPTTLNRPRMMPPNTTRRMNLGPTITTTSDSTSTHLRAPLTMRQVHSEMEEMLQLSDSWSPDPDTMGAGLGRLLGLWTNALDPHVDVTEDSESEWSCSSTGDSDYSRRTICD